MMKKNICFEMTNREFAARMYLNAPYRHGNPAENPSTVDDSGRPCGAFASKDHRAGKKARVMSFSRVEDKMAGLFEALRLN